MSSFMPFCRKGQVRRHVSRQLGVDGSRGRGLASSACPSRPHAAAATLLRRRCRQQEEPSRPRLSNRAAHLLEHIVYLAAHAVKPLLHPALRAGERGCTKGEGSAEGLCHSCTPHSQPAKAARQRRLAFSICDQTRMQNRQAERVHPAAHPGSHPPTRSASMLSIHRLADSQHSLAPASAGQRPANNPVVPAGTAAGSSITATANNQSVAICIVLKGESAAALLTQVVVAVGVIARIFRQLCCLRLYVRLQLRHLLLERSSLLLRG